MFGVFTWIFGLIKGIPGIGTIIGNLFSGGSKVAEIKAEESLEETKAFTRGRISPRFLLRYGVVTLFLCFALMFLARMIWPGFAPDMTMENFERLMVVAGKVLSAAF